MDYLEANRSQIRDLFRENKTYEEISQALKTAFPEVKRGFSSRNVRLFCSKHEFTRMQDQEVDEIVSQGVKEVGATYGRKMMMGYLKSKGFDMSRRQLAQSLKRINPVNHARRRADTVRLRNPIAYRAPYFGNKLHCDQNEKLAMYGCTFYAFSDGCSGKIIQLFAMPKKNAIIIYSKFRETLIQDGIWDMVRVDHGSEAALMLYIQDGLNNYRINTECAPYRQTESRHNLQAERKWPELNHRVSYPIKARLSMMAANLQIDMLDPTVQFCVSFITINVAKVGAERVVAAWNMHPIDGRDSRVPNVVATRTRRVAPLEECVVPTVDEAVQMFINSGGSLTRDCVFGKDPLADDPVLFRRRDFEFSQNYPSFEEIYNDVIAENGRALFDPAVIFYITVTKALQSR